MAARLTRSASSAGSRRPQHQEDLRLRFDVLTKTQTPELHRYWTTRDRGATRRLFRLAVEVLQGIEVGVFPPRPGWQCQECPYRSRCWVWG